MGDSEKEFLGLLFGTHNRVSINVVLLYHLGYLNVFVTGQIWIAFLGGSLAEVLWTQDRGNQLLLLREVCTGALWLPGSNNNYFTTEWSQYTTGTQLMHN